MYKVVIISSSIRLNRKSNRVALFFKKFLEKQGHEAHILDLSEYNFPVFEERLRYQANPEPAVLEFADAIAKADGVLIVTPEYNGGYPASLKNVIDLLYSEWKRKPVAISTVSGGSFGGAQVITSLQFSLWKIGALTIPAMFPVPNIDQAFNEDGEAADVETTEKRASTFIAEWMYWIQARGKM